jgi:hypothetical protein
MQANRNSDRFVVTASGAKISFKSIMRLQSTSFVLILLIWNTTAFCQTGLTNARSFGLCGAYTALATGVDAGRWNPAKLDWRRKSKFSLQFVSIGAGAFNNAFSKSDYDLYNGAYLSTSKKAGILGRIPAEGWRLNLAGEMDLIGISYHNYAVTIGLDFASDAKLSRDFVDLVLNGNKLNHSYNFEGTTGRGLAFLNVGFSYGKAMTLPFLKAHVKKFAIGGTVKYLRGLSTAEVIEAKGSMTTKFEGILGDAQARIRQASGGNGVALDLGAAAIMSKKLIIGMSLRNFPSYLHWSKNTKAYHYGVTTDSLTAWEWASSHEDSVIQNNSEKRTIAGFSNRLPVVIHLGVAYYQGYLIVNGEIVQGLENRLNATTTPELRLGAEGHFLKYVQPRIGIGLGGKRQLSSAIGIGFTTGGFQLDVAAGTWNGIFPTQGKGGGFAFGMRVEL